MVARSEIKTKVVRVLAAVSNFPQGDITEGKKLKGHLLLSSAMVKALADPYTKISRSHGGKRITISEAGRLRTVRSSINLVHQRANSSGARR